MEKLVLKLIEYDGASSLNEGNHKSFKVLLFSKASGILPKKGGWGAYVFTGGCSG